MFSFVCRKSLSSEEVPSFIGQRRSDLLQFQNLSVLLSVLSCWGFAWTAAVAAAAYDAVPPTAGVVGTFRAGVLQGIVESAPAVRSGSKPACRSWSVTSSLIWSLTPLISSLPDLSIASLMFSSLLLTLNSISPRALLVWLATSRASLAASLLLSGGVTQRMPWYCYPARTGTESQVGPLVAVPVGFPAGSEEFSAYFCLGPPSARVSFLSFS